MHDEKEDKGARGGRRGKERKRKTIARVDREAGGATIDKDEQKQRRRDGERSVLSEVLRGTLIRNNNNCRETRIMNVAAADAAPPRSSTFAAVLTGK